MSTFSDFDYIAKIESLYQIPKNILLSLLKVESGLNPDAVGIETKYGRAVGIAQIIPRFHPNVNPRQPYEAIDYTGRTLNAAYQKFGDWKLAVASWHAGENAVRKAKGIPSTSDGLSTTKQYVDKILKMANYDMKEDKKADNVTINKNPTDKSRVGLIVGVILVLLLVAIFTL